MNDYVNSDLSTLALNNGEQLKDFHIRIIWIQQDINLSVETVYNKRLLFNYIKALSKCDKGKAFVSPKIADLKQFLDNNGKLAIYTGKKLHRIYCYIEIIED